MGAEILQKVRFPTRSKQGNKVPSLTDTFFSEKEGRLELGQEDMVGERMLDYTDMY